MRGDEREHRIQKGKELSHKESLANHKASQLYIAQSRILKFPRPEGIPLFITLSSQTREEASSPSCISNEEVGRLAWVYTGSLESSWIFAQDNGCNWAGFGFGFGSGSSAYRHDANNAHTVICSMDKGCEPPFSHGKGKRKDVYVCIIYLEGRRFRWNGVTVTSKETRRYD